MQEKYRKSVFIVTYSREENNAVMDEASVAKINEHYKDVILASVINPILTRKQEENGIFIDNLLKNYELTIELYTAIINYSYGKKKVIP